jgi:hypothetical protein
MTHFKKFFDHRFISAEELDNREVILTISEVKKEEVFNMREQDKEMKAAIKFKETDKMMVLNVTNAKSIATILGTPHVEQWIGQRICLYPTAVRVGREMVSGIRIKKVPATAPKETPAPEFKEPSEEEFNKLIQEG